jgi:flagellar biogenesis protein FliO
MDEGGWVLRTLVALAAVSALAWVVLSLASRGSGLAFAIRTGIPLLRLLRARRERPLPRVRVLERISLSSRQELFLVQADSRVFLLGGSAAGTVALVAELDREVGPRVTMDSIQVN